MKNMAPWPCFLMLTLALLVTADASAQLIQVAADVVQIPVDGSSYPNDFRVAESQTFFMATDPIHGRELWRTDGTAAGTRRVADFCPGACDGEVVPLDTAGDLLYFAVHGRLWKTDGTDTGTSFIAEPDPSSDTYDISSGFVLGDQILFVAPHEEFGRALWISDGTAEGTVDLSVSFGTMSTPIDWTQIGDRVFFSNLDSSGASRLWVSDGTAEGTRVVVELCGDCFIVPSYLQPLGDRLFFVAGNPSRGSEPWITDGTPEGTERLADFAPGNQSSYPYSVTVLGSATSGDTAYGLLRSGCSGAGCIFLSDGTREGTRLAPELFPPAAAGSPYRLIAVGSTLYMATQGERQELWALDEMGGGVRLNHSSSMDLLGDAHGSFFYRVRDPNLRLMATDGTPETTRSLATDLLVYQLAEVGEQTVLGAYPLVDDQIEDSELWLTDGFGPQASLLQELSPPVSNSDPSQLIAWRDDLAWVGREDGNDRLSVWLLNGGSPFPLTESIHPRTLAVAQDRLYVGAFPGVSVYQSGALVDSVDIDSSPTEMVPFQDGMLMAALAPGQSLWSTRGAQDQTELILNVNPDWTYYCPLICPGPFNEPFPRDLTPLRDQTLFVAFESVEGPGQLWSTDGTTPGTRVVREFELDPDQGRNADFHSPSELTRVGDWVYFTAFDRPTGREVWRTDGTPDGTTLVADLTPDGTYAEPVMLTAWAPPTGSPSAVWILRGERGDQLWRAAAEGPPGASWISDFGSPEAEVHEVVASGEHLYLAVTTPTAGRELWVSDGTPQGTRLLDLRTDNPRGSGVANLTAIPGGVFFAAASGPPPGAGSGSNGTGFEPWVSGGAPHNTYLITDLLPGPSASNPGPGTLLGERLYFAATNGETGRELFVLDLNALGPLGCPADRLCLQQGRFEITMDWQAADGSSGTAQRVSSTDDSGLLWFFDADNLEAMVKVLDGCDLNGHFWVFAATSTNVGYTLTVDDLQTGERKTYTNPIGESAAAITDTQALAVCP